MRQSYYVLRIIHGKESPLVQIVSSSFTERDAAQQLAAMRKIVDPVLIEHRFGHHYMIWRGPTNVSNTAVQRVVNSGC